MVKRRSRLQHSKHTKMHTFDLRHTFDYSHLIARNSKSTFPTVSGMIKSSSIKTFIRDRISFKIETYKNTNYYTFHDIRFLQRLVNSFSKFYRNYLTPKNIARQEALHLCALPHKLFFRHYILPSFQLILHHLSQKYTSS